MAAQIGEFMRQYQRKAQGGMNEPNDRQYSRKLERKLKRLKPEELDELLHDEETETRDLSSNENLSALLVSVIFGGLGFAALCVWVLSWYHHWRGYYRCPYCNRPLKGVTRHCGCPEVKALG